MNNNINIKRRGLIYVISSPSGGGKTSISKALLAIDPNITKSVSVTTREPRAGEVEGGDYHFVDRKLFEEKIANNEFLEYATVFDNYYGTLRAPVVESLNKGQDIMLDIDWQGAFQLFERAATDVVGVFILPPSMPELERRLRYRSSDSEEVILKRLSGAYEEISKFDQYDYVIINDDFDKTLSKISHILRAERLRRQRRPALKQFVEKLLLDIPHEDKDIYSE